VCIVASAALKSWLWLKSWRSTRQRQPAQFVQRQQVGRRVGFVAVHVFLADDQLEAPGHTATLQDGIHHPACRAADHGQAHAGSLCGGQQRVGAGAQAGFVGQQLLIARAEAFVEGSQINVKAGQPEKMAGDGRPVGAHYVGVAAVIDGVTKGGAGVGQRAAFQAFAGGQRAVQIKQQGAGLHRCHAIRMGRPV